MQVHSAMEEYDMFPLLDSVHDSPTGLCDLHLEDDFLWMQLMDAMRDYEEEKSFSANYVVATRAQLLWQSMLASMDHSMAKLDYAVLLDVEKESRRLFWFQSSLGYFCVLQGLRDTGVDTVHRIIFKELRSLLLFLQTVRN